MKAFMRVRLEDDDDVEVVDFTGEEVNAHGPPKEMRRGAMTFKTGRVDVSGAIWIVGSKMKPIALKRISDMMVFFFKFI